MIYDEQCCPRCKQHGTLVEFPAAKRHVTWAEHDGRVIEVRQLRCVSCGASDLIQRDTRARFEKQEPQPGQATRLDGLLFSATPSEED